MSFGQKPELFFVGIGEWITSQICGILVAKPFRDRLGKRGEIMGRNRRIPFGYMMINGEMKADPTEMQAVTKIFLEYISGNSLKNIAKLMETMGIPYYKGEPAIWNASMVKRIIENKIYPGCERYPKIIDSSVYNRANELKKAKANNLCLVPEKFKELRDMIVCAECGKRLFRNTDDTWNCKAESCRRLSYNVTDQMIESAVLNMMNSAIANPNLVEAEGELSKYTPNGAVMRQKNEIDRLMDSTAIDFDKIKKAMVRLAEIKYECCSYNDIPQQTGFLKLLFANREQLNELDKELITRAVSKITVSHYATIGLELINGVRLKNNTERNEVNNE